MKDTLPVLRRVGPAPRCSNEWGCPAVFELPDGQFAIIGTDRTEELRSQLPPGAGCAPHERIVVVPRETLLVALATFAVR